MASRSCCWKSASQNCCVSGCSQGPPSPARIADGSRPSTNCCTFCHADPTSCSAADGGIAAPPLGAGGAGNEEVFATKTSPARASAAPGGSCARTSEVARCSRRVYELCHKFILFLRVLVVEAFSFDRRLQRRLQLLLVLKLIVVPSVVGSGDSRGNRRNISSSRRRSRSRSRSGSGSGSGLDRMRRRSGNKGTRGTDLRRWRATTRFCYDGRTTASLAALAPVFRGDATRFPAAARVTRFSAC